MIGLIELSVIYERYPDLGFGAWVVLLVANVFSIFLFIDRSDMNGNLKIFLLSLPVVLPIWWACSVPSYNINQIAYFISSLIIPILIFFFPFFYIAVNLLSRYVLKRSGHSEWALIMTAPEKFPVNLVTCQVKSGGFGRLEGYAQKIRVGSNRIDSASCRRVKKGIGADFWDMSRDSIAYGVPQKINIVWASLEERKNYVADFELDSTEFETIETLLREGYDGLREGCSEYSSFVICCIPGGQLRFLLCGTSRKVCLDFSYQCEEETRKTKNKKIWERKGAWNYSDYLSRIDYTTDIPYGLWDKYFRRYNYGLQVKFQDERSCSLYKENAEFLNGEFYERVFSVNPDNVISNPSVVKNCSFRWIEGGVHYECYMCFNEENIFSVFEKAFREHPEERAVLLVRVYKIVGRFHVSLNFGQASYELSSVEFVIWRLKFPKDWPFNLTTPTTHEHLERFLVCSNYITNKKKKGIVCDSKNEFIGA